MSASLFEIRGLKYGYRWGTQFQEVLKGIDLDVPRNTFACLVGPSGMGKTTLLNLMGLLDRPAAGTLKLDGQSIQTLPERELEELRLRKLGFVFQAYYLIPTLTALENTSYFLPQLGLSAKESTERAEETLARLGLADFRHKKPLELSGGQRQRVAIARALAKRPQVILADEPTANLDRKTAGSIIDLFHELRSEKVSFVFSTHDNHLVSHAEKVFTIRDGTIFDGRME